MDKVMLVILVSVQLCNPDLAKIIHFTSQMFTCTLVNALYLIYKMIVLEGRGEVIVNVFKCSIVSSNLWDFFLLQNTKTYIF